MALITKGIQLFWKSGPVSKILEGEVTTDGVLIPGLQEVGEIAAGKAANAGYDKIEVTTLADVKHEYVNGLQADAGDAEAISFTLLYDPAVYEDLLYLFGEEVAVGTPSVWNVVIPNGGKFTITALGSAKVNSASVNSALTMSLTLTPTEEIAFTFGA